MDTPSKTADATQRVAAPFTKTELTKIDEWGFERRIRNRSDAIRALIHAGMQATKTQP